MKTKWSYRWAAIFVMAVLVFVGAAVSQSPAAQTRPISDFLSTQGTLCIDDGAGGCFLFVPPDPNFLGWNSDTDLSPVRFAGVDYAGLAKEAYAQGQPKISGTVTERPLSDGRAEVTVLLQTQGANVWVIELDLSGDLLAQIASKPTLFGHRPFDVSAGQAQALGNSILHVVFINSAPGAPLPDLIQINGTPDLKFLAFSTQAKGPLTAEFGVPEGTPGKCTISQTGLFQVFFKQTNPDFKGQASDHSRVAFDAFPAESIDLKVIGK